MVKYSSDLLIKYENKWVALSPNRDYLICSGNSIKDIARELKKDKIKDAELMFVYPLRGYYSPYGRS